MPDEIIDDGGEHPVVPWLNERRRAYLYRLITPVAALLGVLGLVDENVAVAAGGVLVALLGTGMAIRNTSTTP